MVGISRKADRVANRSRVLAVVSTAVVVVLTAVALFGAGAPASLARQEASPDAAPAAAMLGDTGLMVPAGVGVTAYAAGKVESAVSSPALVSLIRVTLAPGDSIEPAEIPVPAAVVVDSGTLTLIDELGLEAPYAAGQTVPIMADLAFALRNDSPDQASFLLLSIGGDSSEGGGGFIQTEEPVAAATVEVPASPVATSQRETLIANEAELLPGSGATLFLARTVWEPGVDFGVHTAAGPIGLFVESGEISITRSTGIEARLAAGKGVLFPADIERREQNNGVEPATVLIAGLISGDVGLSIPVAPTPTATAILSPTAIPTDTSTPGPTSTPRPTNTPVPSPTATSTPEPGTAMYEADTDGGLDEWNGPTDWKHLNGMLVNDGSNDSAGVWIAAPYAPRDSDYAVEAEIQLISSYCADGGGSQYESFGIVLRSTDVDSGYWVGVDCDGFGAISLGSNFCCDRLGNQNFAADLDWHTMRAEVEGNVIRLYIDGSLLLEVSDNRFLESGSIGLWTYGVQVNVRGFRVIVI